MVIFTNIYFLLLFHFSHCLTLPPLKNQYDSNSNTFFTYTPYEIENCKKASECELVNSVVRKEKIENLFVCNLDDTISSPCPLSKDNVCICVKDADCQIIYNRFISQDQSLIRSVKNDF